MSSSCITCTMTRFFSHDDRLRVAVKCVCVTIDFYRDSRTRVGPIENSTQHFIRRVIMDSSSLTPMCRDRSFRAFCYLLVGCLVVTLSASVQGSNMVPAVGPRRRGFRSCVAECNPGTGRPRIICTSRLL